MANEGVRIPRWVWLVIGLVVAIVVVVFVRPPAPKQSSITTPSTHAITTPATQTPTTPTTSPTTTSPEATPAQIAAQTPPTFTGINTYPAYQHMPYTGSGIAVSVLGTTPDGKIKVYVYSDILTLTQTKAAYHGFLSLYNDPGTKYATTFAIRPPSP